MGLQDGIRLPEGPHLPGLRPTGPDPGQPPLPGPMNHQPPRPSTVGSIGDLGLVLILVLLPTSASGQSQTGLAGCHVLTTPASG